MEFLAKNARGWKVEVQKRRVSSKARRKASEESEVGGFVAQKGFWKIANRKKAMLREYQAMHEEAFSAVGCGRLNEEAKQEESKSGRRDAEGEKERVEIKRSLDRVSSEDFEDFSPISEVESVGDSFGFSVCVVFFFSNVNVIGEVGFFSDSDSEFVEPPTCSLARNT